MPEYSDRSNVDLKIVALLLALAAAVFHVVLAANGKGISRDQHLGTAVTYARGNIDLLRPVIIGANANDAPTPLEFPIWQALTAVVMKMFGPWYGWGNVVSLLFQFASVWPVYHLASALLSNRAAWWAAAFYLGQPITFLLGGQASADGAAASFAVWFLYCGWRVVTSGWKWWPAAAVFGALSAPTKVPFLLVAVLSLFFWLLYMHRGSAAAWAKVVSLGATCTAVFLIWNSHINRCYAMAELP